MPPVWNQRAPCSPKIGLPVRSRPGRIWDAAVWPRSDTPSGGADAEAALREVQAVAHRPPDAVVRHPAHERLVHAALADEVLDQPADRRCRRARVTIAVRCPKQRARPRATLYSPPPSQARNRARRGDAALARVEAQHDLAEGDEVPARRSRAGRATERSHRRQSLRSDSLVASNARVHHRQRRIGPLEADQVLQPDRREALVEHDVLVAQLAEGVHPVRRDDQQAARARPRAPRRRPWPTAGRDSMSMICSASWLCSGMTTPSR